MIDSGKEEIMNVNEEIKSKAKAIDEMLETYLPKEEGEAKHIMEAMNYSIHVGGKRLRPMLMLESYKLFGGKGKVVEPFMAAIEMIHTYSLVHDDLPAMDNDEYRRGQLSTHAKFGHAMGVLAGDGLLNYAFETSLKAFDIVATEVAIDGKAAETERVVKAMKVLAKKAGIYGMVGGQVVDVESENQPIGMDTIKFIHENKTAAMIESSLMIGAILAGADEKETALMEQVGSDVGLAFQIQDDILDVTSTVEVLGKPIGSDEKNGKTTYLTLVGLDKAKDDVRQISQRAIDNLKSLPYENAFLTELVTSLITRES